MQLMTGVVGDFKTEALRRRVVLRCAAVAVTHCLTPARPRIERVLVRPSERSRLGAIFEYPVNRYASRFDTFRRIRVCPVPAALAYYQLCSVGMHAHAECTADIAGHVVSATR